MKKIFAAGALALAGLFLFGGCAAQASLAFSANWQSGTAYQSDYYEKLTYKLSLDDEKASGNLVFEPDEENSSYTVETQIVSFNSAYQDKTYPSVYKLTSTLVLAGSYKIRETGETVTEEELEKYIEEGATVEKLSAYTVTDKVTAGEAETLITDATAENLIALAEVRSVRGTGRRSYINLDTISANFREGETVDLATLKARGLLEAKVGSFKVLARGQLDKSLTVEANDFSLAAVKMIALTGGKVVRIKKQN